MAHQINTIEGAIKIANEFVAEEKKKMDAIQKRILEVHSIELAEINYDLSTYIEEYPDGWIFRYSLNPVDGGTIDHGMLMVTVNRRTGIARKDTFS